METVAQQLQINPADCLPPATPPPWQPFSQRLPIGATRIPSLLRTGVHRRCPAERDKVRLEFAVWIRKDAQDLVAQFQWPARIRSQINAAQIVVVRVKVVPDERFSPDHRPQFPDRFDADVLGNDLRTGPENLDRGIEQHANLAKIIRFLDRRPAHPSAIGRRAEHQGGVRIFGAQKIEQSVGDVTLGSGGGPEAAPVRPGKPRRNVIEQDREMPAAESSQLIDFAAQDSGVGPARVRHIQTGSDGLSETGFFAVGNRRSRPRVPPPRFGNSVRASSCRCLRSSFGA